MNQTFPSSPRVCGLAHRAAAHGRFGIGHAVHHVDRDDADGVAETDFATVVTAYFVQVEFFRHVSRPSKWFWIGRRRTPARSKYRGSGDLADEFQ